ncbi:class I SAM-dependent methyltransferase [Methylobacterium sp. C25]|uniref:class I SAM-dependent methyltransferase n=1 Tax=Methylobacterium sp. C25 TaxID=2721622 RepID=UPI001F1FA03D|nr:class I SAM-dependent methyltransferase [Methylobacterium sp. C25]MCE4225044.1 class I SAM-dependent methyltransferase [Methylobacterium sp. C25]
MTKMRQDLADHYPNKLGFASNLINLGRYWLRQAVYGLAPVRRRLEPKSTGSTAKSWDTLLSSPQFSTYLGGTINVDAGNSAAATLIKFRAPPNPSVLDVGCCGGTLLAALSSCSRYRGTDISTFAIDEARKTSQCLDHLQLKRAHFEAIDLREFKSSDMWDVIVFSEVLYYLGLEEAQREVERYAEMLTPSGILVVAMKDDAKSKALFCGLTKRYHWADGLLWQRKPACPDYRTRISRECPSFLTGVLVRRQPDGVLATDQKL